MRNKLLLASAVFGGPRKTRFDFVDASRAFDPRITFTRSTPANDYGPTGTLRQIAIDVARANANQDYNPSTLAARGFLIEAGATNLALWNRDFTNAAWVKTDITAAKTATGIDGVANSASTITATADSGTVLQTITSASAARATSCFIKRRAGSGAVEMTQDNGATWAAVTVTADWTRVSIASATVTNPVFGFRMATSGDEIDVDYFQVENNAFPTSPIATTTAATARGSDNAVISNLASIGFSATQGYIYCEFMMEGLGTSAIPFMWALSDTTSSNRIAMRVLDSTSDAVSILAVAGGVTQASIADGVIVTANTLVKAAATWSSGVWRLSVNGVAATAASGAAVPTVTQLEIGRHLGGSQMNGWMPKLQYGPQLLTQSQLNGMTA